MVKRKLPLLIALLVTLIMSTATLSFAWFVSGWNSAQSKIDFSSGDSFLPEFDMWLYTSKNDEPGGNNLGWVKQNVSKDMTNSEGYIIPGVNPLEKPNSQQGGSVFEITMKELHFGKIDNLMSMSDDNVVYCKLKFEVDAHGTNQVSLNVAPPAEGILHSIYGGGTKKIDINSTGTGGITIKNRFEQINTDMPVFNYSAVISKENFTPDKNPAELSALFNNAEEKPAVSTNIITLNPSVELKDTYAQDANGKSVYYMYIKIVPNLKSMVGVMVIFDEFKDIKMPCVMLFNLKFALEVH